MRKRKQSKPEPIPERKIYIIETPPMNTTFQQCVWIASDKEVLEFKKERPDLILRSPTEEEHAVLDGNASITDVLPQEIPQIELTPEQQHIMEVINSPISLHGFGKKKLEITESE